MKLLHESGCSRGRPGPRGVSFPHCPQNAAMPPGNVAAAGRRAGTFACLQDLLLSNGDELLAPLFHLAAQAVQPGLREEAPWLR